jgi:hypothetical protein
MARHNIPPTFVGLTGIFVDIISRIESLERRPRTGTERITVADDTLLDPVTRYVWANAIVDISVTLPDSWDGATVTFKNQTANVVTVFPLAGTIDGGASVTVGGLNAVKTYQSDGANWITL